MSQIKPSSHGIVVENRESGLRYAAHDRNFVPTQERKVRDLRFGESVLSYGIKGPKPSFQPDGSDEEDSTTDVVEDEDPTTGDTDTLEFPSGDTQGNE